MLFYYKFCKFQGTGGELQPRAEARLERVATIGCRQACIYFDSFDMKRCFGVPTVEMSFILFYYELINYGMFIILFCV